MPTNNLMGASSALPQVLVSQQLSTNTETAVYTCPASTSVKIAKASVANTSTSGAVSISVALVKSGGTMGDGTHKIIPTAALALNPLDWRDLSELAGHFLGPGDVIAVTASVANVVDVVISGVVFS